MADFHGTQEVVTDLREDGVLIMRINRPEKRNAINGATSATMEDIMNKAEKDNRVRVIVVTGTGEKAFCAGEDLSELSSGGECMTVTDHGFGGITDRLCPKPTICAVNGVAAGGGMEIAVSCDIVVAAEHARFGLTEPKVGLIASTGGLVRMARDVPRKAAMDMLLTARLVHADDAKEIGFVNYVVPPEQHMHNALEIASTIGVPRNAKVIPTASASILVATASTNISFIFNGTSSFFTTPSSSFFRDSTIIFPPINSSSTKATQ